MLLALLGLGFGAFDALVVRPAMVSFSTTGRRVTGTALARTGSVKQIAPSRAHGQLGVQDAELGWQVVDTSGEDEVGASVPLLCSTAVGRCERLARVSTYVERWPLTPAMGRAAGLLALAVVAAFATRTRGPSAPA